MVTKRTRRKPYLHRKGTVEEEIYPLDKERVTLGRAADNDIVIAHSQTSRYHAHIRQEGHAYILTDLESTNGTFINRRRLSGSHKLRNEDRLQIADNLFIFTDPEATAQQIRIPGLTIAEEAGEVRIGDRFIKLSPKEYALLLYLYKRQGQVVSKEDLAVTIWPEYQGGVADYNIESLARHLREKIEPNTALPIYLITIKKRGYKLVTQPDRLNESPLNSDAEETHNE